MIRDIALILVGTGIGGILSFILWAWSEARTVENWNKP